MDLHGAGQSVAKSSSIAAITQLSFDFSRYQCNGRANHPVKFEKSPINYKIKRLNREIADSFLYSFKLIFCRTAKKQ